MKIRFIFQILLAAHAIAARCAEPAPNDLSESEKNDGWTLLFDGRTFAGWRGYSGSIATDSWSITADGCIKVSKRNGGAGGAKPCS